MSIVFTDISVNQHIAQERMCLFVQNLQLSNRIKERCKVRKLAIKTLLEMCEMNRNTIYDLEKKGSFPSGDKLARIADYLDCSVDYLLGRTDNPEVNL